MQTVIGIFDNVYDAQRAVEQLKTRGFTGENVDVSVRDTGTGSSANYSEDDSLNISRRSDYEADSSGERTTLTGSERSSSDLSRDRDADDDSFGDKISRFFKNLFGNDDDADRYSHVANKTGCVVTVYAQSTEESETAADILDEYGAVDVNERAREYGYSTYNENYPSRKDADVEDTDTLNVIKEDVQVGKREVETGGVRVRSRIVERPVEEDIRLKEEKITVERTPVDRPATTADFQNFKEGEIEMTERAEVADVTKEARVVEEIKLSKEVTERKETVRETARDTEVDIENLKRTDLDSNINRDKDPDGL